MFTMILRKIAFCNECLFYVTVPHRKNNIKKKKNYKYFVVLFLILRYK